MPIDGTALIAMGNNLLSLTVLIAALLIATVLFAKVISVLLKRAFKDISKSAKINPTQFIVLQRLIVLGIYILGFSLAASMIPGMSGIWVSLFASAGVIAIVVGFAAQQVFSNVISGIFIAVFKPFRVGDRITVKNEYGIVEDITLRHTVIRTWKNEHVIIPNTKIGEENITNYSIKDPTIVGTLEIGIGYDSDIDKARKIMIEEAIKNAGTLKKSKGADTDFLKRDETAIVRLTELTDSAQKMTLYYWAEDKLAEMKIKYALMEAIKKRFDKEGIEVPFPYRTIVYKSDLEKQGKKS
ncbi:MAG: mechanosensitive ion channel family protein [archaeon]